MFCAASMSRTFDNPGSLNRVCHDALQKNRFTELILSLVRHGLYLPVELLQDNLVSILASKYRRYLLCKIALANQVSIKYG
jgi:hypothetical protein